MVLLLMLKNLVVLVQQKQFYLEQYFNVELQLMYLFLLMIQRQTPSLEVVLVDLKEEEKNLYLIHI